MELPLLAHGLATPYGDLYVPGAVAARPLERDTVAILFELALGLSAWKQYRGSRGRCAVTPPAEISIPRRVTPCFRPCPAWRRASTITSAATTFSNAAAPLRELRRTGSPSTCLTARSSSACPQSTGARPGNTANAAFRYCQHDVGHALAALRYAAAALGWSAVLLDTWSDDDLAGLFGLDRDDDFAAVEAADREFPDAALLLNTRGPGTAERPDVSAELVRDGTWAGEANRLSPASTSTGP